MHFLRLLIVAVIFLSACSQSLEPTATGTPPPRLPVPVGTPKPERFKSAEALAAALGCASSDLGDVTKDHPTLRDFGVCHINGHNFDLWVIEYGTSDWEQVRNVGMASVKGPGWIVVTPTGDEAARYAHGKLGGDLRLSTPQP